MLGKLREIFKKKPEQPAPASPSPEEQIEIQQIIVEQMIPITSENASQLMNIMRKPVWIAGDSDFETLIANASSGKTFFERVDNPKEPFLTRDRKTRVYVWQRQNKEEKERAVDPRSLVVLYADRVGNDKMTLTFLPSSLWSGGIPFVMIYRMSCCSGLSALISVTLKGTDYFNVIHSAAGVKDSMKGQGNLFRALHVARDQDSLHELLHAYYDVAGKPRTCSHAHQLQIPQIK
jgi:hypothetical protein